MPKSSSARRMPSALRRFEALGLVGIVDQHAFGDFEHQPVGDMPLSASAIDTELDQRRSRTCTGDRLTAM